MDAANEKRTDPPILVEVVDKLLEFDNQAIHDPGELARLRTRAPRSPAREAVGEQEDASAVHPPQA